MHSSTFSALSRLKASTKDLHRTLDRASGMTQLLSPELDLNRYAEIIKKLHGIYSYIEPKLLMAQQQVGEVASWDLKADWLMSDLRQLTPNSVFQASLPEPSFPLRVSSPAALAGCLYVLEGSTLGGQIICRKLLGTLGEEASDALRFFTGYGELTHSKWAVTSKSIEGYLLDTEDIFEACRVAREVFQVFIDHMQIDEDEHLTAPV